MSSEPLKSSESPETPSSYSPWFQNACAKALLLLAGTMPGAFGGREAIAAPPARTPQVSKSDDLVVKDLMEKMYDIYKYDDKDLFGIKDYFPEPPKGENTKEVIKDAEAMNKICDKFRWVDKNKITRIDIDGDETKKLYIFKDKDGEAFAKAETILLKGRPGDSLRDGKVVEFMAVYEPGAYNQMRFIVEDQSIAHKTDWIEISWLPPDEEYRKGSFKGEFHGERGGHKDQKLGQQSRVLIEELAKKLSNEEVGRSGR